MFDWWGAVFAEYYGLAETRALTSCDTAAWLERRGTAGGPVYGVAPSVRGPDGKVCSAGEDGQIFVDASPRPEFTYHGDDTKGSSIDTGLGLATGDIATWMMLAICSSVIDAPA